MRAVIVLFLAAVSLVSAAGINCKGSSYCKSGGGSLQGVIDMVAPVARTDPNKMIPPGGGSICDHHICAFTQHYGKDIAISEFYSKLLELQNNGCKICGSVPILPGNDGNTGELTVNYVSNADIPGTPGKCKNNPQPKCPGSSCYNFSFCFYLGCQGPTPITNPRACETVGEQCLWANKCGCCI